ncbi:MAG: DUF1972 domain-containing protein [Acidobacteriota bacterium]
MSSGTSHPPVIGCRRPLSIAILGTRGIPARYGGFETFAEQLSHRLAQRGHEVTVYGRTRYAAAGQVDHVQSVALPALYTKYLETVSHGLLSILHCARHLPDIALVCNAVNAAFLPLLSAAGVITLVNVDGIEWQRRKWNRLGRGMHRLSEHLAVAHADAVIADARVIKSYYQRVHHAPTTFIPYGGDLAPPSDTAYLQHLGLRPGAYDLCVCRFEPENNPLTVVKARARLNSPHPLVMVGGSPYALDYQNEVWRAAGADVRFLGFRFGDQYRQLLFNGRVSIHAGEVGGTHPAILEAMGAGLALIYNDTPENREVIGPAGLPYGPASEENLVLVWQRLADDPDLVARYGHLARQRMKARYRWQAVTDDYENLFFDLLEGKGFVEPAPGSAALTA